MLLNSFTGSLYDDLDHGHAFLISRDFGSWDNMKNQLAAASVGVQGSGWGWLGYNKQMKKLQITTCLNQDPLQATTGNIALSYIISANP
ncbi:Superoxide dismutase [Operophtera brumata]|uniref:superoxide dismutase n=1 Tax=Operophtera brumata TaxID=104452 RepID=A0A0L7LPV4_OPEBR|nr:Superoxide dismutase [Operophtera brumata]